MKKCFTLMELVVIIIILGILAMVGLLQFFRVAERGRAAEGVALLGSIGSAQLRYAAEHTTTTGAIANLDIEDSSASLKFFNAPVLTAGVDPQNAPTSVVATIQRNNNQNQSGNQYILGIQANGIFTCDGGSADTCQLVRPKQN